MKLLTQAQQTQLIENGLQQQRVKGTPREIDFLPVVRLFNPCGAGTWLLTEIEPGTENIAWGLADLGCDCAEFGTIDLDELRAHKGPLGLGIERDLHWSPRAPISAYIKASSAAGRIVEPKEDLGAAH
jgi:hypothetical protein